MADDDLTQLRGDVVLTDSSGVDVRTQGAKRARSELTEIVDDERVDGIDDRVLECTDRAVRHHERARRDPLAAQQFLSVLEPRCLDHDVGLVEATAPVGRYHDLLAQLLRQLRGERFATLRST